MAVDAVDDSLVITNSTGVRRGSITAQWFDAGGNALTSEFVLLQTFTPGQIVGAALSATFRVSVRWRAAQSSSFR